MTAGDCFSGMGRGISLLVECFVAEWLSVRSVFFMLHANSSKHSDQCAAVSAHWEVYRECDCLLS